MTEAAACAWCSRTFTPRATGGHAQRFCAPVCRRSFDAAGRAWVAEAIATGMLTPQALRNDAASTRALPPTAISPAAISEPRKPAPLPLADSPDDAAELLDALLVTLLADLPETWSDLADALPDEIYDQIDRYLETLLSEGA